MLKKPKFYALIGLLSVTFIAAVWLLSPPGINSAEAAMAEYQIENMTCGSCVGKIETALESLGGVGSVEINLTSNRGSVTYDPAKIDSQTIAKVISEAGFPASLRLELAPQEYAALQHQQSQLGQKYLARIGGRLLARTDFEQLVQERAKGAVDAAQNDQLWQTVWKDVLQRELLLSAAEGNNVVIQGGEVEARLDELRLGHQNLDQIVIERYGSMDTFRERLREEMIINRNIEDHVYAGISDGKKQRAKFHAWYAELQKNTEVVIFDPRLKPLGQGGGCCGGQGGGCGSKNG
jgi:copper chaperone CopZ